MRITLVAFALFLTMSLLGTLAQARDPGTCLDAEKSGRLSHLVSLDLGTAPDFCDPQNPAYHFMETLIYIDQLQFDEKPIPSPYNQEIIGFTWLDRLQVGNQVHPVLWGPLLKAGAVSTKDGDVVCKMRHAFSFPGHPEFYLCPDFLNDDIGYSIMALLHETRHMEGDGYKHVECDGDPGGCDPDIAYKGSYDVSMEVFSKLAVSAKNVDPTVRAIAAKLAFEIAQTRFVNKPQAEPLR